MLMWCRVWILALGSLALMSRAGQAQGGVDFPRCPGGVLESTEIAEFAIHADGAVERRKGLSGSLTISVEDSGAAPAPLFLRIESVTTGSRGQTKASRDCVVPAIPNAYVDLHAIEGGNVWRVTVALRASDATALGFPAPKMLEGATRSRNVDARMLIRDRIRTGMAADRIATLLPPSADEAQHWIAATEDALAKARAAGDDTSAEDLLEQQREVLALRDLAGELVQARRVLQAAADRDARHPRPPGSSTELRQTLERLWPSDSAARDPLAAACVGTYLEQLATTNATPSLWRFGVFDLPTSPADRTITLQIGAMQNPSLRLKAGDAPVTAWATDVKADQAVRFEWVAGARANGAIGTIIASFIGALGPVTMPGAKALAVPDSFRKLVSQGGWYADTCLLAPGVLTQASSAFTALATNHTVAVTTDMLAPETLERDRSYTVYVCKDHCAGDTTGKVANVLAQGTVATWPRWGLTLFGGVTYDFQVEGRRAPYFTNYQWIPAGANAGASQLFRLDETRQPLQSVSTSLLLALISPGRSFAVGFGPDLVLADGSGKFSQWTGNLFWAPQAMVHEGLYFTAGSGFRLRNEPAVGEYGDVVMATMTPTLVWQAHAEWVVDVGIALDLKIVGDAASSVFGGVKTSKGAP